MSTDWNRNNIRKLAGLPILPPEQLTERWDSDDMDDEDADVKIAMGDRRQAEFEKKAKPVIAAAQKELVDKTAAARASKKSELSDAPAKLKHADATTATPVSGGSKSSRALAWLAANKGAKRGEFLAWAKKELEMGTAYGSTFFAKHNPKAGRTPITAAESFVILHPSSSSYMLSENEQFNQMQWIDADSSMEPMIFETKEAAEKVSKYMSEWKGQQSVVTRVVLED